MRTRTGCDASRVDVEPVGFDVEAVDLNGVSAGDDVEPSVVEVRPVSFELATAV